MRLPYSRKKRYLTGIDWLVAMFDRSLKNVSGAGNAAQIIMQLDGALDEADFVRDMTAFNEFFPLLRGRPRRDFNLAPYWQVPRRPPAPHVLFSAENLDATLSVEQALSAVAAHANDPFPDETLHCAFHLARQSGQAAFLSLVFDHRLFDARGAEAFLTLFEEWRHSRRIEPILDALETVEPAHLSHWRDKLRSGQCANRAIRRAAQEARPLCDPGLVRDPRTAYRFFLFDEAQTRAVEEDAYRKAGFLMLSPYLLATCLQALHNTLTAKGMSPASYVVPVSLDMRRPGAWRAKPFFNHVSFMFLTVSAATANDPDALIASLVDQLYEQTKKRVPQHFEQAAMLTRIAPLGLFGRLARRPLKGEFGTLSFSHVGESLLTGSSFAGCPLRNVFHAPRVPIPTGLGFFFNRRQGRLNMTLSYLPDLLNTRDLARMERELLFFRDNSRPTL